MGTSYSPFWHSGLLWSLAAMFTASSVVQYAIPQIIIFNTTLAMAGPRSANFLDVRLYERQVVLGGSNLLGIKSSNIAQAVLRTLSGDVFQLQVSLDGVVITDLQTGETERRGGAIQRNDVARLFALRESMYRMRKPNPKSMRCTASSIPLGT